MSIEKCFRCGADLVVTDEKETLTFYKCEPCNRYYTKALGRTLTDRWLSPITIPLYPIILRNEKITEDRLPNFMRQFDHLTDEQLRMIINDVEEELANPKQLLVDTLDLKGTEEMVRDYLARIVVLFTQKLEEKNRGM